MCICMESSRSKAGDSPLLNENLHLWFGLAGALQTAEPIGHLVRYYVDMASMSGEVKRCPQVRTTPGMHKRQQRKNCFFSCQPASGSGQRLADRSALGCLSSLAAWLLA